MASEGVRQHVPVTQARVRGPGQAAQRRKVGPQQVGGQEGLEGFTQLLTSWALLEPEETCSSQEQGRPRGRSGGSYVLWTHPSTSPKHTHWGVKDGHMLSTTVSPRQLGCTFSENEARALKFPRDGGGGVCSRSEPTPLRAAALGPRHLLGAQHRVTWRRHKDGASPIQAGLVSGEDLCSCFHQAPRHAQPPERGLADSL